MEEEDIRFTYNMKDSYVEFPVIIEYNNYFGSINQKPKDLNTFYDIITKFNKYLFEINYLSNSSYLTNILSEYQTSISINPLEQIKNNIIEFQKYYNSLYEIEELKISDQFIKYTYMYVELIWRSLFMFNQYSFFYNNKEIKAPLLKSKSLNIKEKSKSRSKSRSKSKPKSLSKIPSEIIETKLTKNNNNIFLNLYQKILDMYIKSSVIIAKFPFIKIFLNELNKNKRKGIQFDVNYLYEIFNNIYKLTIIDFNRIFYKTLIDIYISPFNINDEILNKLKTNSNLNKNPTTLFIKDILLETYDKYISINKSALTLTRDTYITIPQYEGICWFISFLTGLTYSDKNKELLLKKRSLNKTQIIDLSEINEKKTDSKIILNSFAYYIIDEITNNFKTYSDILENDCIIFENLKRIPILFLKRLFIEEISNAKAQNNLITNDYYSKLITQDYGNENNFIYQSIINKYNNEKNIFGVSDSQYSVIKKFYDYLNIDCLYIYDINKRKYTNYKTFRNGKDYDIIIIGKNSTNIDIINKNIISLSQDITSQIIEPVDNKIITYNGFEYELDYILQSSDDNKTCKTCGHCVSAIHYNEKEYYYNSMYHLNNLQCSSDDIALPCSLLEYNWTDIIDKDKCFKLVKCKHIPEYEYFDKSDYISEIIIDSSDKICYTSDACVNLCYVKKTAIQGGKSKKIERKVYMDKKTNKYYVNYDNKKIYLSV